MGGLVLMSVLVLPKKRYEVKTLLVSIIVPIFNTPIHSFQRCLSSLTGQTYKNIEIIIVDDGSNIQFFEAVKQLVKGIDRLKLFRQDNMGVSSARNKGVEFASGEYVTFVDSDDEISPYMIEDALSYIEKYKLDVVIGRLIKTDKRIQWHRQINNKNVISGCDNRLLKSLVFSSNSDYSLLDKGWYISFQAPVARIIKKEALLANKPFPNHISISEDTIWNYFLLGNKDIVVGLVPENWYVYYQNPNSALHSFSPSVVSKILDCVSYFYSTINKEDKVSASFVLWTISKARQILRLFYKNKMCKMGLIKKVVEYHKIMNNYPFSDILVKNKAYSKKINLQIVFYKSLFGFFAPTE